MSLFIDPNTKVAVSDENGNTVYVRAKMPLSVKTQVSEDFRQVGGTTAKGYELALLQNNLLGWEGPLFADGKGGTVSCNRYNIRMIDPEDETWDALAKLVLEKIGELNHKPTAEPTKRQKMADPN